MTARPRSSVRTCAAVPKRMRYAPTGPYSKTTCSFGRRKFLHQADAVPLAGFRTERTHARKRIERDLIRIGVERFVIQAAEVGLGVQEEISKHNRAEALNCGSELLVRVVLRGELLHFRRKCRIDSLPAFSAGFHLRR